MWKQSKCSVFGRQINTHLVRKDLIFIIYPENSMSPLYVSFVCNLLGLVCQYALFCPFISLEDNFVDSQLARLWQPFSDPHIWVFLDGQQTFLKSFWLSKLFLKQNPTGNMSSQSSPQHSASDNYWYLSSCLCYISVLSKTAGELWT